MHLLSSVFLGLYRFRERAAAKLFSVLIAGGFARFGRQTVLSPPLRVSGERRIEIGNGVYLGSGCWLQTLPDGANCGTAIVIGNGVSIAGSCVISAVRAVHIEADVLMARNVYISDHIHRYRSTTLPVLAQGVDKVRPVVIKAGAWLGQNVVVCPGVSIGTGAVVGANSVVTEDVPDYSVAVGSPARVVKCFAPLAS